MLGVVDRDKSQHIHPLGDEIGECLLDRVAGPKINGIGAELNYPFDDVAIGFLIAENVTKWELRDYRYVVGIEVEAELPGCDKVGI